MVNCPRCSEFYMSDQAEDIAINRAEPKLSAWIRKMNEQGAEAPKIIRTHSKTSQQAFQIVLRKADNPSSKYRTKDRIPGKSVVLTSEYDYPLAWASNPEEFVYYLNSLQNRGFLIAEGLAELFIDLTEKRKISDELKLSVTITADGWDYLEKQERHIEERTQAFVAMSFSDDLKSIWEGPIKTAIKKAGYKPFRVDAEPHSERIDAKISQKFQFRRSRCY